MKEKGVLPSMILIDGGKGQLNVAIKVLQELDLFDKIDLISISKNDNHKSDTIHLTNGQSIKMEHEESFFQLARIQDEVHRFTINFHRKKRNKKLIS
jgi:excinuclease ABC subunit C